MTWGAETLDAAVEATAVGALAEAEVVFAVVVFAALVALAVDALAVVAAVVLAGVAAMTAAPARRPRTLAPAATERERQDRFQELMVDRCICMDPMVEGPGESDVRRG